MTIPRGTVLSTRSLGAGTGTQTEQAKVTDAEPRTEQARTLK
jgi:hypothetical protein